MIAKVTTGIRRKDARIVVDEWLPITTKHVLTIYIFGATVENRARLYSAILIAMDRIWSRSRSPAAPNATKEQCYIMSQTQSALASSQIDIRNLMPAKRHAKIFELISQLAPGVSFVLVNDHDPKPLYYQLEAEHPKQFSWSYLEKGPQVWRVEIGRLLKAA